MKTLLELITIEMKEAFEAAGYDAAFAKVTLSNRPDLCEYQCNGAMAAAKTYKKAPIMIANDVVAGLQEKDCFEMAEAVNPGFINLKVKPSFAASQRAAAFPSFSTETGILSQILDNSLASSNPSK